MKTKPLAKGVTRVPTPKKPIVKKIEKETAHGKK
jgi:hypothetical protein